MSSDQTTMTAELLSVSRQAEGLLPGNVEISLYIEANRAGLPWSANLKAQIPEKLLEAYLQGGLQKVSPMLLHLLSVTYQDAEAGQNFRGR
ncbi:hypothetical protein [Acetobacter tropicalis]|uniref:hypothetical protein n=1 Tax=Acetobacter tropicalis TaxID=104102 RepID=UPI0012FD0A17|nr:hypothetical protein [Acetobacter tropicalis]